VNVLMITSSYPKFPGDVTAPFIESIAHAVVSRGHTVDIVLPYHPALRRPPHEPVRFFPYRYAPRDVWSRWGYAQSLESDVRLRPDAYLLAPLAALALRAGVGQRLLERRYDVVHAHWLVPNAALVADQAASVGVPLVVSLHGSDVFLAERLRPARGLARTALRLAGAVTACSTDLQRRALALGARPGRTRVVPYGVDVDAFSPRAGTSEARRALGVEGDELLVLALGRLVEKKGFAYLVDAAAQLSGLRVVIAGDGDLRPALEARARERGAAVTLVGNLDRGQTARALAAADAVVVPSIVDHAGNVDGLPNALLEALAAGRPVVATRVAGIPDVVEDDVNGLLVPPRDAGSLAAALARLAREPETRTRLGAAARHTAETRLTWSAVARAFEESYAQAAALAAR
jgi:glycosyltransferase involved in cell wall biosynthesis